MPGTANSGGRNAKSAQMHVLTGTFRGDRHGSGPAPEPPKGRPTPPGTLKGEALAEWERMVDRLEQSGTLSVVDDAALYQYAELYAETEGIKADQIENRKLTVTLKRAVKDLEGSELVQAIKEIVELRHLVNKGARELRQGHLAIRQYLVEFGMTPAARSRVKVSSGGKATSKVDAFRAAKAGA